MLVTYTVNEALLIVIVFRAIYPYDCHYPQTLLAFPDIWRMPITGTFSLIFKLHGFCFRYSFKPYDKLKATNFIASLLQLYYTLIQNYDKI